MTRAWGSRGAPWWDWWRRFPRLPRSCGSAASERGLGKASRRARHSRGSAGTGGREGEAEEPPLRCWMDGRDDAWTSFGRRMREPPRPSNTRPHDAPPLRRLAHRETAQHPIGRTMEFFAGRGIVAAPSDDEGGGSRFPEPQQHGVWFCFLAATTGESCRLLLLSPVSTRSCYDLC
jgi:hypothetical protein